jgi:8-oxo-dGTP pyrophosphatase MutT (NUDIX family)
MDSYDFSRPTHFTASVFVLNEGKVLLLKQTKSKFWLLPGGHIDDGELPHEAAIREVKEETNLDIEILQKPDEKAKTEIVTPLPVPFAMRLLPCRDKKDIDFLFTAKVVGGELKIDDESEEAKWFSKEEIINDPSVGPNTKYYASLIFD